MNANHLIVGVVGLTAGAFALFVPVWNDIRRGKVRPENVREAELLALAWSLAFTSVLAVRSNMSEAYLWWLVTAGGVSVVYEYGLYLASNGTDCGCGCGGNCGAA